MGAPFVAGDHLAGPLSIARRDPVDDRRRLAVDMGQERRPARRDPGQRSGAERHGRAAPGDPVIIFDVEIVTIRERYDHSLILFLGWRRWSIVRLSGMAA